MMLSMNADQPSLLSLFANGCEVGQVFIVVNITSLLAACPGSITPNERPMFFTCKDIWSNPKLAAQVNVRSRPQWKYFGSNSAVHAAQYVEGST